MLRPSLLFAIVLVALPQPGQAQPDEPAIELFFAAASIDRETALAAQAEIAEAWRDGYAAILVDLLDPGFADFFEPPVASSIRLDEIQWGGVGVNGIPPLDHPDAVGANDAAYLADDNIVFGIEIDGAARAYPKRILAWHELARDRVGGRELTVVYCTLCGTVMPFASDVGGKLRTFGTSGLLYQSNKLMFDSETKSLWSSLSGEPVVGPLVGSGLALTALPVVTTTWGEWRRRHPATSVLSLDTGYERDYSEGAA